MESITNISLFKLSDLTDMYADALENMCYQVDSRIHSTKLKSNHSCKTYYTQAMLTL